MDDFVNPRYFVGDADDDDYFGLICDETMDDDKDPTPPVDTCNQLSVEVLDKMSQLMEMVEASPFDLQVSNLGVGMYPLKEWLQQPNGQLYQNVQNIKRRTHPWNSRISLSEVECAQLLNKALEQLSHIMTSPIFMLNEQRVEQDVARVPPFSFSWM